MNIKVISLWEPWCIFSNVGYTFFSCVIAQSFFFEHPVYFICMYFWNVFFPILKISACRMFLLTFGLRYCDRDTCSQTCISRNLWVQNVFQPVGWLHQLLKNNFSVLNKIKLSISSTKHFKFKYSSFFFRMSVPRYETMWYKIYVE